MFRQIFYKYSVKSRKRKIELFFNLMKPVPDDIFLDIGGGTGKDFEGIWKFFNKVIIVDMNPEAVEQVKKLWKNAEARVADGCNLPFEDKSVDFVFSNAVIEHIDKRRRWSSPSFVDIPKSLT